MLIGHIDECIDDDTDSLGWRESTKREKICIEVPSSCITFLFRKVDEMSSLIFHRYKVIDIRRWIEYLALVSTELTETVVDIL